MYMPYLMCGYAATVILMLAGCYAFSRTMPGLRGMRLLVGALFCGLMGVSLLAVRPIAPAWVTILLANGAIFLCSLLIYCATAEILDIRASFVPWGLGVSAIAVAGVFAGVRHYAPSPDSCRVLRAGGRVKGRVAPAWRRRRRP